MKSAAQDKKEFREKEIKMPVAKTRRQGMKTAAQEMND